MHRYWDWSLDWEDLVEAPVFDSQTGFGGDGDPNGESTNGDDKGRCITDGPFKDLRVEYFNSRSRPHCISRGFYNQESKTDGSISGKGVRPEAVDNILGQTDYESFFKSLEEGPHDAIPHGIRGEFFVFTAPNGTLSHPSYHVALILSFFRSFVLPSSHTTR
jgi:tyrosinase